MSLFKSTENLIYLESETKTSKGGNNYTLVKLADPQEYQRHDFFKDNDVDVTGFKQGDLVVATLNLDTQGYNQNLSLVKLEKK